MKVTRYLLARILIPVLLGSCASEEIIVPGSSGDDLPSENLNLFYMYTDKEDVGTRTINGSGNVVWSSTDRINVNGETNVTTDIMNEGAESKFGFTDEPLADNGNYYAVYPASFASGPSNGYLSAGVFNVTLPQAQAYKDGTSFSDGVNLSVASSPTNELRFYNVCGIVKASLKLKAGAKEVVGVKTIRFLSNTGKPVSGTAKVDAVTKKLALNAGQSEAADIVFATPQTITSSMALDVLWSLPPNSYDPGWRMQLVGEADNVLLEVARIDPLDVKRSKITSLGVVELEEQVPLLVPVSNSYVVALGHSIKIPVSRANESPISIDGLPLTGGQCIQLGASDSWTAEVVWQDPGMNITFPVFSGTGATGTFTVHAGFKEGNAVVAIKKGGVIMWSWHIWVTGFNPDLPTNQFAWDNDGDGTTDIVFMGRNLGASSNSHVGKEAYGLYYQWGRKDPFPEFFPISLTLGLTESVRKPQKWIAANGTSLNNWFGNIPDDTLWGGVDEINPSAKSVFDPCPSGWRVPVYKDNKSPFARMSSPYIADQNLIFSNGYQWDRMNMNSYFPSSGQRTTEGAPSLFKEYGCYWSASPRQYTHLGFFYGNAVVTFQIYRAGGASIRCMKE